MSTGRKLRSERGRAVEGVARPNHDPKVVSRSTNWSDIIGHVTRSIRDAKVLVLICTDPASDVRDTG
jgi:hypothetical protein